MGVGFDHFGEIVGGAGEREVVFGGKCAGGLCAVEGLFVASNEDKNDQ